MSVPGQPQRSGKRSNAGLRRCDLRARPGYRMAREGQDARKISGVETVGYFRNP